jgi:hypothetical protein
VPGHFQKISLGRWVGHCICPRSTSSGGFQTFGLLFREFLKHGTPHADHAGSLAALRTTVETFFGSENSWAIFPTASVTPSIEKSPAAKWERTGDFMSIGPTWKPNGLIWPSSIAQIKTFQSRSAPIAAARWRCRLLNPLIQVTKDVYQNASRAST